MINVAWNWARGTYTTYQTQFNKIRRFEDEFKVTVLSPRKPRRPPSSPVIPLMWCMEVESIRTVRHVSRGKTPGPIALSSVRQIRSAVSQFYQCEAAITAPSTSLLTREGRLLHLPCRPTDNLSFTMFATGLVKRLGITITPSKTLLERHVHALDQELEALFNAPHSLSIRRDIALGGFANVTFWLAWLRSAETFYFIFEDVAATPPHLSDTRELPPAVRMLEYTLLLETKTAPTFRVDVIVAAVTSSGLNPLRWFQRVKSSTSNWSSSDYIFVDDEGSLWSSKSFRQQFLYPCLERLKSKGDTYLQGDIPTMFWSLHCYRRGVRTHVDRAILKHKSSRLRKTVDAMVYKHGWWRRRASSHATDVLYHDWSPKDRVLLTKRFF